MAITGNFIINELGLELSNIYININKIFIDKYRIIVTIHGFTSQESRQTGKYPIFVKDIEINYGIDINGSLVYAYSEIKKIDIFSQMTDC